jgi:hypothetical protein
MSYSNLSDADLAQLLARLIAESRRHKSVGVSASLRLDRIRSIRAEIARRSAA